MATKEPESISNPEDEIRRLRDKSDKGELEELKRGLFGGYKDEDVASYVARLKHQLQSSERMFKNYIAQINAEKDQLRNERDNLESRLAEHQTSHDDVLETELQQARKAAEAFLADRAALEEKYRQANLPNEQMISELRNGLKTLEEQLAEAQRRNSELRAEYEKALTQGGKDGGELRSGVKALEEQLAEARKRNEELKAEYEKARTQGGKDNGAEQAAFQAEKAAFQNEKAALQAEKASLQAERENLKTQIEAAAGRVEEKTAGLRYDMLEWKSLAEAERAVSARYLERLEEAGRHLESLAKENASLASQVDAAKQKIMTLLHDKEAMEGINEQMRKAMNTLVAKAESVMKENNVINTLLESEREKVQQYRAMNDKLSDTLARMRISNQMLEERAPEVDRAAAMADISQSRTASAPAPAVPKRVKEEVPAFAEAMSGGGSNPMQDIISEFNSIQANLARYQQAKQVTEENGDKKPSIRYSVEKFEMDRPPEKADNSKEDFRLPGFDFSRGK